jgi:hypothetical protein
MPPPIILFGAEDAPVADKPVAPGVRDPLFAGSMFDAESVLCEVVAGINVLSRWVEEAEDSLAESGLVACFRAEGSVSYESSRETAAS